MRKRDCMRYLDTPLARARSAPKDTGRHSSAELYCTVPRTRRLLVG